MVGVSVGFSPPRVSPFFDDPQKSTTRTVPIFAREADSIPAQRRGHAARFSSAFSGKSSTAFANETLSQTRAAPSRVTVASVFSNAVTPATVDGVRACAGAGRPCRAATRVHRPRRARARGRRDQLRAFSKPVIDAGDERRRAARRRSRRPARARRARPVSRVDVVRAAGDRAAGAPWNSTRARRAEPTKTPRPPRR